MSSELEGFGQFFRIITQKTTDPFPYQSGLAAVPISNRLIRVPTGAGKTCAAIITWLWRLKADRANTPTRLVYCLPMRALVEQTVRCAKAWCAALPDLSVTVHTEMGGEIDDDWQSNPVQPQIIVGTQDMLLSRALNRGYAMNRYRWPIAFGLLNNDCLWILDEIQIMGSGLATTTQLEAFRRDFGSFGPVASWWMSATAEPDWLNTVDFLPISGSLQLTELTAEDLQPGSPLSERHCAVKPLERLPKLTPESVIGFHRTGALTLVVLNTVQRAQELYKGLTSQASASTGKKRRIPREPKSKIPYLLLHSRFRSADRKQQTSRLLLADAVLRGEIVEIPSEDLGWIDEVREHGLIAVCTQVVEAGLDISAERLITELAPWASLVQRFGRLNRFGKQPESRAAWVSLKKSEFPPYENLDLDESLKKINILSSVSIECLASVGKLQLLPIPNVIRRHDLHGLFATESDLAGGFTDVSRYVRDNGRDVSVFVFWREAVSQDEPAPTRDELCAVLSDDLAEMLKTTRQQAWEWNFEDEEWALRRHFDIRPGMTLLLKAAIGGYSSRLGWTGDPGDKPEVLLISTIPSDGQSRDRPSETAWYPLTGHLIDAEGVAASLVENLHVQAGRETQAIVHAARWHDLGKLHPRWQAAIGLSPAGGPWAKFSLPGGVKFRPGLRHEAASAIAAFTLWQNGNPGWTALAVYLIASHHGKVRTVLRSRSSKDGVVFGLRLGDQLPSFPGWLESMIELDLSCRYVGVDGKWNEEETEFVATSPSWIGMIAELLGPESPTDPVTCDAVPQDEPRNLGPFRLAYMEALVAAADVHASRNAITKGASR